MKLTCFYGLCLNFFVVLLASTAFAQTLTSFDIELDDVVVGLEQPVGGAHAGDGSGRLFVLEQKGEIRIIENGALLNEPFLDIRSQVRVNQNSYDERGLLGLAFHPDYANNGRFFIYYSAPREEAGQDHISVVAEYQVSPDDPNVALTEETRLLTFGQPQSNHNGGQLAFGSDGMLYIASGDGGGANDQHGEIGNGQNTENLLGKILRIDVDGVNLVPDDNPFVGADGADEIWAYGLRNPWRFSFDRMTGRLFAADVGQNRLEEVNIIERGGNYGWRIMEGTDCFNPSNCDPTGLILPIAEYSHGSNRISITGGYVYRGSAYSSLYGKYVCADYAGDFFVIEEEGDEWQLFEANWRQAGSTRPGNVNITSFVEDEDGELYVMYAVGSVFNSPGRLARVTVPGDEPVSVSDWKTHE